MTACFTGHRSLSHDKEMLTSILDKILLDLIRQGFDSFICGGAMGFDLLCGSRVLYLRSLGHKISLHMYLPCRTQTERWRNFEDIVLYKRLVGESDSVRYVSNFYSSDCMLQRNRLMVDNADICIAYLVKSSGGTAYTVNYAKRQKRPVLNVALSCEY